MFQDSVLKKSINVQKREAGESDSPPPARVDTQAQRVRFPAVLCLLTRLETPSMCHLAGGRYLLTIWRSAAGTR
ncbi:hypothetical protein E4U54_006410 [Claviceps lovelessii]|nr:hypothetical protein E4U54_006410 [Claviceps lovelessii]